MITGAEIRSSFLEFFRERDFVGPLITNFAMQFAYMGGFVISPLAMMGPFGLGQAATSMWTIARPVSLSAMSPVGGTLGARFGERALILSGALFVLVGMLAFALGAGIDQLAAIIAGLILCGMGMGLAQPSLSTVVASSVGEQDHGIAVSTMSTTAGIGAVAGVSILTALCADVESPSAFRDGYLLGAAFAALGVVAAGWIASSDPDERGAPDRARGA